jgi:hypothetical protein
MRDDVISIREFQKKFKAKEFNTPDVSTQCKAGWYDWFCKDTALAAKTRKLGNVVMKLQHAGKVDLDKMYVFFKNNCPMKGPLYDDFRICSIETGNVLFTVQNNSPWEINTWTVYGALNEFKEPLYKTDTVSDLIGWLNEKEESIDYWGEEGRKNK